MPLDLSSVNSRIFSDLAGDLEQLPLQDLPAYLRELEMRLPWLRNRVAVLLGSSRQEWLRGIRAGLGFVASKGQIAVAGQFSCVQLFNPVGSGKRLLVYNVQALTTVQLEFITTFRTALDGASGGTIQSLLGNIGSASSADLRSGSNAAVQGTTISDRILAANTDKDLFNTPQGFVAELREGHGLSVWGGAVNTALGNVLFSYLESPP